MTLQTYGTFGFLNPGQLAEEPLMLLDFGIEKRQSEKYDFYNDDRDYDGFLFQYTFQGEGVFETEEGSRRLSAGTAFFSCIPEKSRYYLPAGEPENRWEYLYVHFQGPAAVPFFRKIRDSFGPVVTVPADSFPIQLWLNLHEVMTMAGSCGGMRVEIWFTAFCLAAADPGGTAAACADALCGGKHPLHEGAFPGAFFHRGAGGVQGAFLRLFHPAFYQETGSPRSDI
ncbi:MAG: AraC family ligand binding domain-containing protein [Eisenbergiella massiliensis]